MYSISPHLKEIFERQLAARAGKARYQDNLSYHALRLAFVHAVLPDARIIHVIRDPREAVCEMLFGWTNRDSIVRAMGRRARNINLKSLPRLGWQFARNYTLSRIRGWRATWGPRVPGLAEFVATHGPAEVAAYQWVTLVQTAPDDIAALTEMLTLEVRYDQLVADPEQQAIRISSFIEAKNPDVLTAFAASDIKTDYVHWEPNRIEPTDSQWHAVNRIISPLQRRLGYD